LPNSRATEASDFAPIAAVTEGADECDPICGIAARRRNSSDLEVSVIIGYQFKSTSDATAEIGTATFAMSTQDDGAWIKTVAEEARMVDAMRKGSDLTIKGTSGRGTQSTDQYSLQGLAQALDRAEQECK